MNNSGQAVKQAFVNGGLTFANILIVCDDIHLDFGKLRLRWRGSDAGHNGLRSIIEQLETPAFPRLRCGIGLPGDKNRQVEYVLGEFATDEKERLDDFISRAVDCCELWISEDAQTVMSRFNGQ
jgi:PTH1 family peptidyl-tRNA hydrolase